MRITACLVVLALLFITLPVSAEDRAVCAVCGPREGAGFEPVKATATYRGKQYFFCSTKCKIDFLKNPESFLVTDTGSVAPEFQLETFDGKRVQSSDFKSEVLLLDFWATFCPPCMKALPELQALHSKNASRGFSVIGVTVDDRAALVKKATSKAKVTYPILQATPEVWNAYKVNALPSLILVGRDGRIIKRFGAEADKKAMLAAIEQALQVPAVSR
ncbi:MAG TPA: redoxin family protein [Thermoanaerobaculia bacterium]|nr:redoxin family protein [Thermoanaerobaculia bacterium]